MDLSPLNWLVAGPDASLRANRRGLGDRVRGTTSFTMKADIKEPMEVRRNLNNF